MNPISIVALSGPAGCGKDTAGKYLIEQYGFKRLSFAAPIYDMLEAGGFGRPTTQEQKEEVIPTLDTSWRHLAQTLGTEWGRALVHPDLWIILADRKVRLEGGRFVITDCRFENEAAMTRMLNGVVAHIRGRGHPMSNKTKLHASEKGIEIKADDKLIDNGSDIMELYSQLDDIVRYVGVTGKVVHE